MSTQLPPEGISQSAWDEAMKVDAECQRNGCKRPECNGFLCRNAVEAYAAAIHKPQNDNYARIPVTGEIS